MENLNGQEGAINVGTSDKGQIDYIDNVGTTAEGGLTIQHDGITYSSDDEAMIEYDGTVYTMDELNNYEETQKYKPQIAKSIKTAKDAKNIYDYLKFLTKTRMSLNLNDTKKKKKIEELKDPGFFTNKIKSFVNDTGKGISDFTERNKNSRSAYIIGIITTIFTVYFIWSSFKITYISSYFYTFLFLLKRLLFFILIITLIIFTYAIIIKYVPWFVKQLIKYFILTLNPLSNNKVNDNYHYYKQWKFIANMYLGCAYVYYAFITLCLLLFLCFVLGPGIILLGYAIGVCLTFMDN